MTRKFSTPVNDPIKFTIAELDGGKTWTAQGHIGESVMEAGIFGGVPFEVACGGNGECCTCHVYLNLPLIRKRSIKLS